MLELAKVGKIFSPPGRPPIEALIDISFRVNAGEFVALVGPSGCGKSTLLRLVAGLDTVTSGSLVSHGQPIAGPSRRRGMVFQQAALFPWLSVADNIASGLRFAAKSAPQIQQIVHHYLDVTGLTKFADYYPNVLSGGMKQRVAIARTLANEPEIVLLDEPFGALDAQTREQMQEFLAELFEREHPTMLFVTHDIEEALYLADRVIVLGAHPGRVHDTVNTRFARPRTPALKFSPAFVTKKKRVTGLIRHQPIG